jgi:hypothetical protein
MSRDGVPVALATIDATAQGINQDMWIMRQASSPRSQNHAKGYRALNCQIATLHDGEP